MARRILSFTLPLIFSAVICLPSLAAPPSNLSSGAGLTFASDDELRGVPLAATPFSGQELPKKVDLSANMPPPGNQGNQNSCVGWATAYALKSYQEKIEERRNFAPNGRLDAKAVFSPAFIYNQINNGRDGGSTFSDALNLLSNQGAVSLAEMPYSDRDYLKAPPSKVMNSAKRYRIDYWRQVNIRDLKEVKAQLNAGYPVLIGALIDEGFIKAKTGYVWKKQVGQSLGGHAMVLVGYDDAKQAFKLINSWGTDWGEKGYGWVDYKFFPKVVREGYVAKDAINSPGPNINPNNDPDPETDPDYDPESDPDYDPDQEIEPVADQAEFNISNVEHNLPAPAQQYKQYGPFMKLTGPIQIPGGAGQHMQIVVRFYFDDGHGGKGKPVTSRVPEIFSLADEGIAATGTPQIELPAEGVSDEWYAYMPYNAFSLPPGHVDLVAEPILYVDSFGVSTGELIRFWVETPGTNQPQQKPSQTGNAAQAAQAFFQSMYDEDYTQAWALLSESSRQGISQLLADEMEVDVDEVRELFDSEHDTIMTEFWPTMRESMEIDSWISQSFSVKSAQGSTARVLANPIGAEMIMRLEGNKWKLDYIASFMDD